MNKKQIGHYIARKRKEVHMTQKDLADALFVSFQAVSKWERGVSLPDIEMLENLTNVLHISMYELLYRSSSKYSLDDLILKLNEFGITKDTYNDVGLLVQAGLLDYSFIDQINNPPVRDTLIEIYDNVNIYLDMKLIQCAHRIMNVYANHLNLTFDFTSETIEGVHYRSIVDDIPYDTVVLNKVIMDFVKDVHSVVFLLNTNSKDPYLYIACSDDLVVKGFSAFFISNLIARLITKPSEFGSGGGGVHNRAGFSLKPNQLIDKYQYHANRLVKEYTKHYANYHVSITSHTN